jgi:hypothetical protein
MILSAFISFWPSKQNVTLSTFKEEIISWRGFAFGLVVGMGLILIILGQSEIKNLQEIAKIPTRNDLETILKKDRQDCYQSMLEKLPGYYEPLHERFIKIPNEQKTPDVIAEILTDFFLSRGSDNAEPISFKGKMSPQSNVSLFLWVENYENEIVDKSLDTKKINTRIGRFVYDFIYEQVSTYLSLQDPGNNPKHKKHNEPTISDLKRDFIDTALEKIYKEKLPNEFDFKMLDVYEKERKERVE